MGNMDLMSPSSGYALTAEDRALLAQTDAYDDVPSRGPVLSAVIQPSGREMYSDSPKYIADAKPGMIALRFSADEASAVTSFACIPFAAQTRFNIFEPDTGTEQGAYVDTLPTKPSEATWRPNAQGKKKLLLPDASTVQEQRIVYVTVDGRPIAFEAHSTALKATNDWLDRAKSIRVDYAPSGGTPERFRGMPFARWKVSVLERREASYCWFTPQVTLIGRLGEEGGPTLAEALAARRMRESFVQEGVISEGAFTPTPKLGAPAALNEAQGAAPRRLQTVTTGREEPPPPATYDGPGDPLDDDVPF
jgi:hypothetical protein